MDNLRDVVAASQVAARDVALHWELLESLGRLLGCDEMAALGFNYRAESFYFQQVSRDNNQTFRFIDHANNPQADDFWRAFRSSTHLAPWIPDDMATVTKPTDFLTEREWRNLPLYVDFFREGPETSHELMMCRPDGFNRQAHVLFCRNSGRDFNERERFELQLLMPHVEAAYRRAERLRSTPQLTERQRQLLQVVAEGTPTARSGAGWTSLKEQFAPT